jgi:hypothetical protein
MLIGKYRFFLMYLLLSVAGKLRSHLVGSTVVLDEASWSSNLARIL